MQTKTMNGWKKMILVGTTLASLIGSTKAQTIDQRLIYNEASNLRSQTVFSENTTSGIAEFCGKDSEAGLKANVGALTANLGMRDKADLQSTRANFQLGNPQALKAGLEYETAQTTNGVNTFLNGYVSKTVKDTTLDVGANTDNHFYAVSRTAINPNNSVGLAAVLSDGDYCRYGASFSHSGTVGLFGYAIEGRNADNSKYEDLRLVGGLGGKTKNANIGAWGVDNFGFVDEDLLEDLTAGFMSGSFNNYGAQTRGNPIGFDARFKNDVASLEVALTKGILTVLPKVQHNLETDKTSYQLEAHANLGKGFYAKAQTKFEAGQNPNNTFLVGYKLNFGGQK